MWRLLSHLALLATASASLVISEVADKGAADACDGEEWVELHNRLLRPSRSQDESWLSYFDCFSLSMRGHRATAPRGCSSTTRTRRTT